jgi:hypothetical protein
MRIALGILSAIFLLLMLAANVFSGSFASGWEGGRSSGPTWETYVSTAPLIYALHCLFCAIATFSPKEMFVTGIVAHALLTAYLATLIVQRLRHPGATEPTAQIFLALFFVALWFARYKAICRQTPLPPSTRASGPRYDY